MIGRLIRTIGVFIAYGIVIAFYNPLSMIVSGEEASHQFDNSDFSAISTQVTFNAINGLGGLMSLALIAALMIIWYQPIVKFIVDVTTENNKE